MPVTTSHRQSCKKTFTELSQPVENGRRGVLDLNRSCSWHTLHHYVLSANHWKPRDWPYSSCGAKVRTLSSKRKPLAKRPSGYCAAVFVITGKKSPVRRASARRCDLRHPIFRFSTVKRVDNVETVRYPSDNLSTDFRNCSERSESISIELKQAASMCFGDQPRYRLIPLRQMEITTPELSQRKSSNS